MQRIVSGALAGLAATMAMTMAMRRVHHWLDVREKYPLPPREIFDETLSSDDEKGARVGTLAAHFGFGALMGAIFALLPPRGGALYGVGVWGLSYLGWIPAAGILAPAWRHPAHRNALMIAAHLMWGTALAGSLRELEAAEREAFGRPSAATDLNLELQERGRKR